MFLYFYNCLRWEKKYSPSLLLNKWKQETIFVIAYKKSKFLSGILEIWHLCFENKKSYLFFPPHLILSDIHTSKGVLNLYFKHRIILSDTWTSIWNQLFESYIVELMRWGLRNFKIWFYQSTCCSKKKISKTLLTFWISIEMILKSFQHELELDNHTVTLQNKLIYWVAGTLSIWRWKMLVSLMPRYSSLPKLANIPNVS